MNFTHLLNRLTKYSNDKIVFVGLGNKARGDDVAGLLFTDILKSKSAFQNSKFVFAGKNPENHLQEIINYNPDAVVFIDAANWGGTPGEIMFLNSDNISNYDFSTHAFSIKLIEKFILLNRKMDFHYIGIQTKSNQLGKDISEEVRKSIIEFFNEDEKSEER